MEFCKFTCIQVKIIDIGRIVSMAYIEVRGICHESISQAGIAKHLKTAVWIGCYGYKLAAVKAIRFNNTAHISGFVSVIPAVSCIFTVAA